MQRDFIIVGQGIAGSLLAWFLRQQGKTVLLIDKFYGSSASRVAAGIMHPITGRRMVKTWMADELIPFARSTYRNLEQEFGMNFFHDIPIAEILNTAKEYNDWMSRSDEQDLSAYISTEGNQDFGKYLNPFFKSILIHRSGWIDTSVMLDAFRKYFQSNGDLLDENFDHVELNTSSEKIRYQDCEASHIIFCEGVNAISNPFWKHLPFIPAKGEMITFRAEMNCTSILNRKIFLLPVGDHMFKAGSTYSWNYKDDQPSPEGKDFLVGQLKSLLKIPFEVIAHTAGIRPSVKDRKPFLGLHPVHKRIGIFNGLGAKGCLLAPFFASHMAGYLAGKNELMKAVNVAEMKIA